MKGSLLRNFLIKNIFDAGRSFKEILSCNIVGSFSDTYGIEHIGDIDIVIIVDHLHEWLFNDIINSFAGLGKTVRSKYGYRVCINSTFGPIKYNKKNTVVFHVMIYDIMGHILHCRKSPFTCYDWQRTKLYAKLHISKVYAVRSLMPHYFFNARRSAGEYLNDFSRSVISYRYYSFSDGAASEITAQKKMSIKDKYEFAYHIVRFVMNNFLKMLENKNTMRPNVKLLSKFTSLFPSFGDSFISLFNHIYSCKKSNRFPRSTTYITKGLYFFLRTFEKEFYSLFPNNNNMLLFMRHEKTAYNKGSVFLGQTMDPDILIKKNHTPMTLSVNNIFSSPLKRCLSTAHTYVPHTKVFTDTSLLEIDYGKAEGNDYPWLAKQYPAIIRAWHNGKDPKFPCGENHVAVAVRMKSFIKNNIRATENKNILVITHNVWIRVLLGTFFKISKKLWYMISVP
ncbi:histidine phosphatase family protein, partial [Spirochaetota bacterium]